LVLTVTDWLVAASVTVTVALGKAALRVYA